ncbi:LysM peptidoglycan-binding domain-containing protein [Heliophilum fasciatum]|uniref:LysM domain-containing protein n=1 Tax=Heliophilum fasciatum TaxID=35700 RepID=A0A4R2RL78_9FIRM|nr:LysM peptidoglycan-binding domain-containing protein [Heliophilum fasciatum]MCW2278497.1 LysM repeat protein [Heliophilum fasciatum]TCP63628.1 LysM domain-containing protein [Heliophilum fasciatum]
MPIAQGTFFLYTVYPSDTIYSIGLRLGSTVEQIEQLNALYPPFTDPGLVFPGQILIVPYRYNPTTQVFYFIRPGDSMYSIANQFSTSVETLNRLNPQIENPNWIYPSFPLKIPVQIYIVSPGDSLYNIANRSRVSIEALIRANRGRPGFSPDVLFPDYGLVIPDSRQT